MKKDYLLAVTGIVPLFFLIYLFSYVSFDKRKNIFDSSVLLEDSAFSGLKAGSSVKFTGKLTPGNRNIYSDYPIASFEKKIKEGDISRWVLESSLVQKLEIKSDQFSAPFYVTFAEDYIPCGNTVDVKENEKDRKKRLLGLRAGSVLTGYGKIQSMEPLVIESGHTACAENFSEYSDKLGSKSLVMLIVGLVIAVPSLFLVYLGLFRKLQ